MVNGWISNRFKKKKYNTLMTARGTFVVGMVTAYNGSEEQIESVKIS